MGTKVSRSLVAVLLVAATLVALGGRADAAGGVEFVGGKQVAPYTGNYSPDLSFNGTMTLVVWSKVVGTQADVYGRIMAPDATSIGAEFPIAPGAETELRPVAVERVQLAGRLAVADRPHRAAFARRVSSAGALLGASYRSGRRRSGRPTRRRGRPQRPGGRRVERQRRHLRAPRDLGRRGARRIGRAPLRRPRGEPDLRRRTERCVERLELPRGVVRVRVGGRQVDSTQRRGDLTNLRAGT